MLDDRITVLVRADANREMGIGHAMRCLAVSEQLVKSGCRVIFAMQMIPDALLKRLQSAQIELHRLSERETSASALLDLSQQLNARHVMIDGYHMGHEFDQSLYTLGIKSMRFDDYMPGERCHADIVVNASPHAEEEAYRKWAPRAKLLLGPQYIAFRSDMVSAYDALKHQEEITSYNRLEPCSIMVNFGGSDHLDMTIRTVTEIAKLLPEAKIEAVTGAGYPEPDRIAKLGIPNLIHHHNSNNLAEIIQRARMAISAGGLTVTELALFRIPTILAITAYNQIKGAHASWCHTILPEASNTAINTDKMLEQILAETERLWQLPDERQEIIRRIPKELDIYGAKRIADNLLGAKL